VKLSIVDDKFVGVPQRVAADMGGTLVSPRFVVLHYTAGGTAAGALATLLRKDDAFVSAHLVIDTDGSITQCVPFKRIAYHAGESEWKGYKRLNTCSIGIELVNPGYRRPGFELAHWPTVKRAHKNGGPVREWFVYPDAQIAAAQEAVTALRNFYESISEVLGHDEVAPARKLDPGPALDWTKFRS
jgi:N-acetylmuramoyl-L-alanine amidase